MSFQEGRMASTREPLAGGCGCAEHGTEAAGQCCCGVNDLVHAIGRKYAMSILNRIGSSSGARFTDLQHTLAVSSSTLAETLDDLVRVGLVLRTILPDTPPATEYTLTAAGKVLRERFRPLLDRARTADF